MIGLENVVLVLLEFCDYSSFTMEKYFSIMRGNIERDYPAQEETKIDNTLISANESRLHRFFGEIISRGLSRPSKIDIHNFVELSLNNKSKTLLEILTEQETKKMSVT